MFSPQPYDDFVYYRDMTASQVHVDIDSFHRVSKILNIEFIDIQEYFLPVRDKKNSIFEERSYIGYTRQLYSVHPAVIYCTPANYIKGTLGSYIVYTRQLYIVHLEVT